MLYAKDESGERILPIPDTQAICPNCGGAVRAKCGVINEWHWAHIDTQECDPWSEPESEWHFSWKKKMPNHQVEVVIEKNGQRHRADIEATNGMVIELQHSYISPEEIREREAFYEDMIWIFDLREVWLSGRFELEEYESRFTYRWKHPRKHITFTKAPCFLDFGIPCHLFQVGHMLLSGSCYGWGKFHEPKNLVVEWQRTIGPERCRH
jgi:competence protein CoiA